MPHTSATLLTYSWFTLNLFRTFVIGVGVVLALSLGVVALEHQSSLGLVVATASVCLLVFVLWLVWQPAWQAQRAASEDGGARASIISLQKQARMQGVKRWASAFGAVAGASIILLVGTLVFFGGSQLAGFMFFCSGCMAMRAAWTLLRAQRSSRGQEG